MEHGDLVRVTLEVDGIREDHYGQVRHFFKRDRQAYKRTPAKPYGVVVELRHAHPVWVPVVETKPEIEDFEIITSPLEVHRGAAEYQDWTYHCMACNRGYPVPADVIVIHKLSGSKKRFCTEHNTPENRVGVAESAMWDVRRSKQTLFELRDKPELLLTDDYEGGLYRDLAEIIRWALPPAVVKVLDEYKEKTAA